MSPYSPARRVSLRLVSHHSVAVYLICQRLEWSAISTHKHTNVQLECELGTLLGRLSHILTVPMTTASLGDPMSVLQLSRSSVSSVTLVCCAVGASTACLSLGTSQCQKCSNVYLLLSLPFAAAGVVLVCCFSSISSRYQLEPSTGPFSMLTSFKLTTPFSFLETEVEFL